MRKSICILLTVAILTLIVGCSAPQKIYTHNELTAMPSDQLLNLFVENGLEISDRLQETFTDAEFQSFFKSNFENLCLGYTAEYSDVMYSDLADQVKEIYEKLTGAE